MGVKMGRSEKKGALDFCILLFTVVRLTSGAAEWTSVSRSLVSVVG